MNDLFFDLCVVNAHFHWFSVFLVMLHPNVPLQMQILFIVLRPNANKHTFATHQQTIRTHFGLITAIANRTADFLASITAGLSFVRCVCMIICGGGGAITICRYCWCCYFFFLTFFTSHHTAHSYHNPLIYCCRPTLYFRCFCLFSTDSAPFQQ